MSLERPLLRQGSEPPPQHLTSRPYRPESRSSFSAERSWAACAGALAGYKSLRHPNRKSMYLWFLFRCLNLGSLGLFQTCRNREAQEAPSTSSPCSLSPASRRRIFRNTTGCCLEASVLTGIPSNLGSSSNCSDVFAHLLYNSTVSSSSASV